MSATLRVVGERQDEQRVTDFPADGDDLKVSLRNSQWATFDPDFAEMLRQDYPGVWNEGGNQLGNTQYRRLRPVVDRGGVVETDTEEEAVRLREAWGARHYENNRIAGVVAQVKWFVVGALGEGGMKDVLREAMAKEDERRDKAVTWRQAAEGVTLCPPVAVRDIVAAADRQGASLWALDIADRIVSGMVTAQDLRELQAYADDEPLLGGIYGALWAEQEQRRIDRASPLGWIVKRDDTALTTDEQRADYWRDWEERVWRPSERRLRVAFGEWLAAWAQDIAGRVPDVLGTQLAGHAPEARVIPADLLEALMGSAEAAARLRRDVGPQLQRVIRLAFQRAARDMALSGAIQWSPTLNPMEMTIGELIVQVEQVTKDAVAAAVRASIEEGLSVQSLQRRLLEMPEFGRVRSLRIARTETARMATLGTNTALDVASQQGARVKRQWITARDPNVRPSHQRLDGETTGVGEAWLFPPGTQNAGVSTQGPGLSGLPEEDINCRCAVRPVIERGDT